MENVGGRLRSTRRRTATTTTAPARCDRAGLQKRRDQQRGSQLLAASASLARNDTTNNNVNNGNQNASDASDARAGLVDRQAAAGQVATTSLLSHSQVQSTIVANVTQPALPIVSELNKELHPDLVDKYRLIYKDNTVFLLNSRTIHGNEIEN